MASSRHALSTSRRIPARQPRACLHQRLYPFAPPISHSSPTTHTSLTLPTTIPRRAFSIAPAVTTAINTTQDLILALHTLTGVWFVTIPLVALSINLVARLPLAIYTRRILQRRVSLTPLTYAWYHRHARDVQADPQFAGVSTQKRTGEIQRRYVRSMWDMNSRFGVQRWKDYCGFAVFPVWLVGIESIRRLCGGPRGLMGQLVAGEEKGRGELGEAVTAVITTGADQSLATGGCLWFPDLLVPDPTHILPFALSAVMVANILPRTREGLRMVLGMESPGNVQKGSPRLTRVLLVMAVAVGPITIDLPAALHLYWLSTSTIAFIQNELINRYMLLPKQQKICRVQEYPYPRPRRQQEPDQSVTKEP